MKKLTALLGYLLLASCQMPISSTSSKDLPFHQQIERGTLENGLRYFLLENTEPQDRVYIRLVVNAGSLNEEDDQKGVAHIVEHMAFNGTKRFPNNQIIQALEQLGMQFARDINAFTDFENTVYTLNLSDNNEEKLALAFEILHEWMHNLTILPQDLENERGIVLEEWRSRLSPLLRLGDKKSAVEMANSLYVRRDPIGTPESIKTVPTERVRDFYEKWYRPDNMSLIIVGDFNKTKVRSLLREKLAQSPKKQSVKELPKTDYRIPLVNEWRMATISEKAADYRTLDFSFSKIYHEDNSIERYKQDVITQVAMNLVNARLQEWEKQHPRLINSATFYQTHLGRETLQYIFSLQLDQTQYQTALQELFKFIAQIHQNGFTEQEFKQEIERLHAFNQRKSELKLGSLKLANDLMTVSVMKKPFFLSQTQEYELNQHILNQINPSEVKEAFEQILELDAKLILITQPENKPLGFTLTEVKAWWQSYLSRYHTEWKSSNEKKALPALTLPLGKIQQQTHLDRGNIDEMILSNGSKLIYHYSDKQPNQVYFKAVTQGGYKSIPVKDFHSLRSAVKVIDESGIGNFSQQELNNMFSQSPLGISTTLEEYHQGFLGAAKATDLSQLLTLFHLKLNDINIDENSLYKYKKESLEYLNKKDKENEFARLIAQSRQPQGETVYSQKAEHIQSLTTDNMRRLYQHYIQNKTDFTYFIVGDIEKSQVIALAEKYLAGMETKKQPRQAYTDKTITPKERLILRGFNEPRAEIELYLLADNQPWKAEHTYLFDILAEIIQEKLRLVLREQESGIYSANASIFQEPEINQIEGRISFSASPKRVENLLKLTHQILDEFLEKGVDETMLAKKIGEKHRQIKQYYDSLTGVLLMLEHSYLYAGNSDLVYLYQRLEQDVTQEKIQQLMKLLLKKENRFEAVLTQ
ncbi:MAG: insulinase family protein [Lonepinella koalarum]|nr:insulinase family protein [Lonepinella koalarum]